MQKRIGCWQDIDLFDNRAFSWGYVFGRNNLHDEKSICLIQKYQMLNVFQKK